MVIQNDDTFDFEQFLSTLTHHPGVYRMIGPDAEVVYVGKAKSLRNRVTSYFRGVDTLTPKTRALMAVVERVEVTMTHTETEALLLENSLIKEHMPRFNILLRDDKSYPYIHVATDARFPRLAFHRGARRKTGRYFGPYASAGATRDTLNQLQKLFQVRQCEESFFKNRSRPCLQHQIGRCTAPCVELVEEEDYAADIRHAVMFLEGRSELVVEELVSRMNQAASDLNYEMAARYRDQIANVRRVQERQYVSSGEGNIDVVAASVREGLGVVQVFMIRDGQNLGNKTFFPRHTAGTDSSQLLSAFLPQFYLSGPNDRSVPTEILVNTGIIDREALVAVLGERAGRKVSIALPIRGERARWLEMACNNAELALTQQLGARSSARDRLESLRDALRLDEPPSRIECFDISHTMGEATVASCVVFGAEGAIKSDYRRFNIRGVTPGDDYGAMRQALERRYTRLKREEAALPDVLLIDGGKGQLAQAEQVLDELQIQGVTLVGVAKGEGRKPGLESLFLSSRDLPIHLQQDSMALHLIQNVRDEAHRFAITGHRTRRGKARRVSTLEQIPGVGEKRRHRLISEFGGLQGVARAGVEDLSRIKGVSRTLAQLIYDSFRDGA
ncbi:MAG: excinuclease ABC subunit UvrC [Chromatiales bacterium]|nr:excinuclease ABC subunit UvrC [Chromatiales bacterium]